MHLFGLAADIQIVNKDRNLILELAKDKPTMFWVLLTNGHN